MTLNESRPNADSGLKLEYVDVEKIARALADGFFNRVAAAIVYVGKTFERVLSEELGSILGQQVDIDEPVQQFVDWINAAIRDKTYDQIKVPHKDETKGIW